MSPVKRGQPCVVLLVAALLLAPALAAGEDEIEEIEEVEDVSEEDPEWAAANFPVIERTVNLHNASTTRAGSVLIVIDHRTFQPFTDNSGHDFFGLDSGALKIGIGLRYGILDDLDIGLYRLNDGTEHFDTYELDVKYRVMSQEQLFVNLALRAGVSLFVQADRADASGYLGQLMIDRMLFGRLLLGTGVLFHSESTSDAKTSEDDFFSLAIPAYLEIRILPWLAWNVEAAYTVAGYGEERPAFASAIKFVTERHTFSMILTNSQYIASDGVVTNAWRDHEELIVGFSITREIAF